MASTYDNPVWHALNTAHASFADWSDDGLVALYQKDVTQFHGVERLDAPTWEAIKAHLGHRAVVTIRTGTHTAPDGWEKLFAESLTQYVAESPDPQSLNPPSPGPGRDIEIITLTIEDVPEMIALTKATEPGPFLPRTHELGHYIGIRQNGALVAMAGERMRTNEFSEISAVCVAESARRQGLAAMLTTTLVHEIQGRGLDAMLHVMHGNDPAHNLYQRIGFRKRAELNVGVWRWIGDAGVSDE